MAPADPSAKLGLSLDAIIAQSSRPGGRSGGSRGFSGRAQALSDFDSDAGEHREREPAPAPRGGCHDIPPLPVVHSASCGAGLQDAMACMQFVHCHGFRQCARGSTRLHQCRHCSYQLLRRNACSCPAGGGGGGSGRKVFVANLNYQTEWQHLKDHFKGIGNGDRHINAVLASSCDHVILTNTCRRRRTSTPLVV